MEKNPDIQFHSPEEIKLYQEARLSETLAYCRHIPASISKCSKNIP